MTSQSPGSFREYMVSIAVNLGAAPDSKEPFATSVVKEKILKALWDAGDSFPRGWVKSSVLLRHTKQKYFDRRIRELRDETGCDLETGVEDGQPAYRLRSTNFSPPKARTYLSAVQKDKLFEAHRFRCSVCGKSFERKTRGLEADHKVPISRGGGPEFENWQPLCVNCNVSKRRSCQGCTADCQQCGWAYPEKFGALISVQFTGELLAALNHFAEREGATISDIIQASVRKYLASKP
jgi:5-methylcytosine-specific restriction endonuclease McrA